MKKLPLLLTLLLVALQAGCAPIGGRRDGRDDFAPNESSPVAKAAAASIQRYGELAADEWQRTADKAGEFRDWQAAFDDTAKRTKVAREKAFAEFDAALDAATGKDSEYDAAKMRAAATEAAKGFRGK